MNKKVWTYLETDAFCCEIEQVDDIFFIHLSVSKFTKEVLKEMKQRFLLLLEEFADSGIPEVFCYVNNIKFLRMVTEPDELHTFYDDGKKYYLASWQTMWSLF